MLDASLALVSAPLGSRIDRNLRVKVDGRYAVEVLKSDVNGLLLHNLPAGRHWIEIRYGDKTQGLEISLRGGRALTVTFGLSRLAFLSRLRVKIQKGQVEVEQWLQRFSDLEVDEIYYEKEWEWLEDLAPGSPR